MDKIKLLVMLIFEINTVKSQNLILNSSFETETRSSSFSLLNKEYSFTADSWFKQDNSTPDFYSPLINDSNFKTPNNKFGYVPAKDGNNYIGLIPISWDGYFEHLTATLLVPLDKDSIYQLIFF